MPALGLGHPPQDVRLALGHPLRDQLVDRARHDLALPGFEKAPADLVGSAARDHGPEATRSLASLGVVPGSQIKGCALALVAVVAVLALAGCGGGGATAATSTSSVNSAVTQAHHAKRAAAARRTVPALIPPPGAPARSVQVPVLTYHRVAPLSAVGITDLKVDPANFVAELAAIDSAGYHTISQAQLFEALYKGAPLPPKPIIISVDDGYVDDVTRILPALERFHMVATFFVITGRMTEPGFLSAAQIRRLDAAGMDVGDHTAHHVDLRVLTPSELQMETAGSRQVLEHVLGHPVYFFAYPFGAYNDNVVAAVKGAGFTMAYTTAGGTTESTSAPLTMPRIHVGRAETPSGVLSLLGGA
ncbi:MAG TPA: polysaccharide deacetylase family protein [Solirubrobacteraceae bacterium]|nr:polysaccharide deacetylase family protein [Solirubrobacteraceae bacterium]